MYIQNEHRSPLWPALTAHRLFWENQNNHHIYEYDPTDDGPEAELGFVTKAIQASHTEKELRQERLDSLFRFERKRCGHLDTL